MKASEIEHSTFDRHNSEPIEEVPVRLIEILFMNKKPKTIATLTRKNGDIFGARIVDGDIQLILNPKSKKERFKNFSDLKIGEEFYWESVTNKERVFKKENLQEASNTENGKFWFFQYSCEVETKG